MRIVRDCIMYCREDMPRYNPINISGYHISRGRLDAPCRRSPSRWPTCIAYVEEVAKTGMRDRRIRAPAFLLFHLPGRFLRGGRQVPGVAPRLWAKIMKERFGATKPESMRLRFHCQTAARLADGAAADEQRRRGPPSRRSPPSSAARNHCTQRPRRGVHHPLRGGDENRAAHPADHRSRRPASPERIDPLGRLVRHRDADRSRSSAKRKRYLDEIDALGGTVACIESGYFQRGDRRRRATSFQLEKDAASA